MFGLGLVEIVILLGVPALSLLLLTPIPAWLIVKKAGFAPAWGLLAMVPVVNIIGLWILAFTSWPAQDSDGQRATR